MRIVGQSADTFPGRKVSLVFSSVAFSEKTYSVPPNYGETDLRTRMPKSIDKGKPLFSFSDNIRVMLVDRTASVSGQVRQGKGLQT